jgi:hypothetical protein
LVLKASAILSSRVTSKKTKKAVVVIVLKEYTLGIFKGHTFTTYCFNFGRGE